MAEHLLKPGDHLPDLNDGDTVVFQDGTHLPFEIHGGPKNLTFRAQNRGKATIVGSVTPDGEPDCGARFHDGCDGLTWDGIHLTGSAGRGLRITNAAKVTVRFVRSYDHLIEGCIVGNCIGIVFEDCTFEGNGKRARSNKDRSHGLYVSGNSQGFVIRRCRFLSNTGSGCQINGATLGFVIAGGLLELCDFEDDGTDGTPALSLIGVCRSIFRLFLMVRDNAGITMFTDGEGSKFQCRGNEFRDFTATGGKWLSHELDGSSGNTFAPGKGFAGLDALAAPAPAPAPAPTPPPTVAPSPAAAPPVITPPPPAPAPAACDLAPLTAEIARLRAEIEAWPPNPYLAAIALAKAEAAAAALIASLAEVRAALHVPAPAA